MRVYELHYSDRSLTSDLSQEWWTSKGLLEDLLHGITLEPTVREPVDEFDESLFTWVMFELDGLDEQQLSALKLVCGDVYSGEQRFFYFSIILSS